MKYYFKFFSWDSEVGRELVHGEYTCEGVTIRPRGNVNWQLIATGQLGPLNTLHPQNLAYPDPFGIGKFDTEILWGSNFPEELHTTIISSTHIPLFGEYGEEKSQAQWESNPVQVDAKCEGVTIRPRGNVNW